jgi:hypothetical protein
MRSGIFFFDQFSQLDPNLQKLFTVALSLDRNPIARYLFEHHAPVHEGLVITPKAWKVICPRPDHWHVMAGPIVASGQLVGVVGCTREKSSISNPSSASISRISTGVFGFPATTLLVRLSPSSASFMRISTGVFW